MSFQYGVFEICFVRTQKQLNQKQTPKWSMVALRYLTPAAMKSIKVEFGNKEHIQERTPESRSHCDSSYDNTEVYGATSRKPAYIMLTPLNPIFI